MNRSILAGVLRASGTYASGFAVARLVRLALYPVLLAVLPPEELGLIGLLEMVVAFLAALMGLKLETAVTRFFWVWRQERRDRESLGAIWLSGTLFNGLLGILLWAVGAPVFAVLASQLPFSPFAAMATVVVFCQWQWLFLLLVLRAKDRAGEYSSTYALTEASTTAVAVASTVFGGRTAASYAIGWALAWLVVGCGVMWRLRGHLIPTWRAPALLESLRFSLPLVPRDFTSLGGGFLDRFFLDKFLGAREIGLYTAGMKIGATVLAANAPLKHVWFPSVVRTATVDGSNRPSIGPAGTLHLLLLVSLAIAVAFGGELFFYLTRGNGYGEVQVYVPLFVLTFLLAAVNTVVSVGLYAKDGTVTLLWLAIFQTAFQVVAFPLVLRTSGFGGVALVLCVTNTVAVAAGYVLSQRRYRIDYDWRTIAPAAAAFVFVVLVRLNVAESSRGWWISYLATLPVLAATWWKLMRGGLMPSKLAAVRGPKVSGRV